MICNFWGTYCERIVIFDLEWLLGLLYIIKIKSVLHLKICVFICHLSRHTCLLHRSRCFTTWGSAPRKPSVERWTNFCSSGLCHCKWLETGSTTASIHISSSLTLTLLDVVLRHDCRAGRRAPDGGEPLGPRSRLPTSLLIQFLHSLWHHSNGGCYKDSWGLPRYRCLWGTGLQPDCELRSFTEAERLSCIHILCLLHFSCFYWATWGQCLHVIVWAQLVEGTMLKDQNK